VVSEIARSVNGYKVIVEKSTVPVYTNEWISRCMHRHGVDPHNFDVVSNPEFLREGTAIIDFLHPDRIVVGANNPALPTCCAAFMRRSPMAATTPERTRFPAC
jgi:UDPglucose 6-dehydrogenase